MAVHYSLRSFFRTMPAPLLARYFHRHGHFQEFDFSPLDKGEVDTLIAAWLALPEDARKNMEGDFQDIFALCRDAAIPAMKDEPRWHLQATPGAYEAFVDMFAALPNHHARAMTLFLDFPACWPNATRLYHADSLSWWRKRKGFPCIPSAKDDASVQMLSEQLRTYFFETQGRARHVLIEQVRRDGKDYYFCYLEDYSRQSPEWDGPVYRPRPHNPAFEVVYIWIEAEGRLDLNFRGDRAIAPKLQELFARTILKLPALPPGLKDESIYELGRFMRGGFEFRYDAGSGIEYVAVRMIRLTSKLNKSDRITVEANPDHNPDAVYELLAQMALPLHGYYVSQVELTASVVMKTGDKAKKVPIRLTSPNSCSLKYDALGTRLRAMLAASGIEPTDLVHSAAA